MLLKCGPHPTLTLALSIKRKRSVLFNIIYYNTNDFNFNTPQMLFWQLCSGIDENAAGACAQLVFAPIDESFADDSPLLPSGFRVIPLEPKTVG